MKYKAIRPLLEATVAGTRAHYSFVASAALAVICVLGLNNIANASVISTFSVIPNTITAGQQSILDLSLTVTPDVGYSSAQFTGGSVTLYSGRLINVVFGDGSVHTIPESQGFSITPGLTSEDFQSTFSYPSAGNYTPNYSFTADFSQSKTVVAGDGSARTFTDAVIFTDHGNAPLSVAATPLPASLPFFVTGLGALGLLGWRRKKKAAALSV
jgi:prepilin-type processing-associated H-X9-DG protein